MPEKLGSLVMKKTQPALVDRYRPEVRFAQLGQYEQRARNLMFQVLSPEGMKASLDGRFGHIFFRDSDISADFIDASNEYSPDLELWSKTKQAVFSLWRFQREDGKLIHEAIRYDEMLKKRRENPYNFGDIEGFYRPVDEYLVNDDSIDATPLTLIVTPKFFTSENDRKTFIPKAKKALRWMMNNMDENSGFLRYERNKLSNQGWMDSEHGVVAEDGSFPEGPIALVEAQALTWKAFKVWSELLAETDPDFGGELWDRANELKIRFNEKFAFEDQSGPYFAHALDGNDNQIRTPSINPGLSLWANHDGETIYSKKIIPHIVSRLVDQPFLDPDAGIRTFEKGQPTFDEEGYHNGEDIFWPFATGMVAKGMLELGYKEEAIKVLLANMSGILHFDSFIETFSKNGSYRLFRDGGEDGSCWNQTWTTAMFLWSYHFLRAHLEDKKSALFAVS